MLLFLQDYRFGSQSQQAVGSSSFHIHKKADIQEKKFCQTMWIRKKSFTWECFAGWSFCASHKACKEQKII
jgi:hypothetical protein